MTRKPSVSLTSAQNRPKELKAAIASCLAQSIDAWEAVVVDDHSDHQNEGVSPRITASCLSPLGNKPLRASMAPPTERKALAQSPRLLDPGGGDDAQPSLTVLDVKNLLVTAIVELIYTRRRCACNPSRWPAQTSGNTRQTTKKLTFYYQPRAGLHAGKHSKLRDMAFVHVLTGGIQHLYLRTIRLGDITAIDEEHVSY